MLFDICIFLSRQNPPKLITVVGFVLKKDAYAENNTILPLVLGPVQVNGNWASDVLLQYYTTLNPEPPHTHLFGLPIGDICHSHKAVYGM